MEQQKFNVKYILNEIEQEAEVLAGSAHEAMKSVIHEFKITFDRVVSVKLAALAREEKDAILQAVEAGLKADSQKVLTIISDFLLSQPEILKEFLTVVIPPVTDPEK